MIHPKRARLRFWWRTRVWPLLLGLVCVWPEFSTFSVMRGSHARGRCCTSPRSRVRRLDSHCADVVQIPLAELVCQVGGATHVSSNIALEESSAITGGRGIRSMVDIEEAEELVRVPRGACLCVDIDPRNPDWSKVRQALASELKNPSKLPSPYVDLLPELEDFGAGYLWPVPELARLLEGTMILGYAVGAREEAFTGAARDAGLVNEVDPNLGVAELQPEVRRFLHADVLARSRGLTVRSADNRSCFVLMPWIDMFNFKPGSVNCKLQLTSDGFVACAACKITKGDEIFIDYGPKGNHELFLWYGFAIAGNEFNSWGGIDAKSLAEANREMMDEFAVQMNSRVAQLRQRSEALTSEAAAIGGWRAAIAKIMIDEEVTTNESLLKAVQKVAEGWAKL